MPGALPGAHTVPVRVTFPSLGSSPSPAPASTAGTVSLVRSAGPQAAARIRSGKRAVTGRRMRTGSYAMSARTLHQALRPAIKKLKTRRSARMARNPARLYAARPASCERVCYTRFSFPGGRAMGIIDFVKGGVKELAIARPDEAKGDIVYKHPDQTIPMKAQLTVDSDEL